MVLVNSFLAWLGAMVREVYGREEVELNDDGDLQNEGVFGRGMTKIERKVV